MAFAVNRNRILMVAVPAMCITALPVSLFAQTSSNTMQSGQAPDPLLFLKQAFSDAGANALTSAQETAPETLITNFRSANQPTVSATRLAYDNYILSGDIADAVALIPALKAEEAALAQAEIRRKSHSQSMSSRRWTRVS